MYQHVYFCLTFFISVLKAASTQSITDEYPITGGFLLQGTVNGEEGVITKVPWQAYNAEAVNIFGYTDYEGLVQAMNDTDYIPYKTVIMGNTYGLMIITVIKYLDSTTGP